MHIIHNAELFTELFGKHLEYHISLIHGIWSMLALVALTIIVGIFTGWRQRIAEIITLLVILFVGMFVSPLFVVFAKIAVRYLILNANLTIDPLYIKILFLTLISIFSSAVSAITYYGVFKIIRYFSQKRTHDFGIKFFIWLLVACAIPSLLSIATALIYCFFV